MAGACPPPYLAPEMTKLILILGLALVVVLIVLRVRHPSRPLQDRLARFFHLDPASVELIGSDFGKSDNPVWLLGDHLVGKPDAMFLDPAAGEHIIGEAKSRRFRGRITDYERYQVTLYLGLVQVQYGLPARGLLRYGCGQVVPIEFDPDLYEHLISLQPECRRIRNEWAN